MLIEIFDFITEIFISIFIGSSVFFLVKNLIDYLFEPIIVWKYYKHIFINENNDVLLDESNEKMRIYTFNEIDWNKYYFNLWNSILILRKYVLRDKLDELKYNHFDFTKISIAHISLLKQIIFDKNEECLLVQRMTKPRDYFELIALLLINKRNAVISILNVNNNRYFYPDDFTIERIMLGGSHLFFRKNGKRKYYKLKKIIFDDKEIIILTDIGKINIKIKSITNVENIFFSINIYKFNNIEEYGVEILENSINLNSDYLWYIGQFLL